MKKILLIPTLNEEKGLEMTLREYMSVLKDAHILVADGGSTDRTVEVATRFGAEVIKVDERGKGRAIAHALDHIRKEDDPDVIIFTDGDYTYPVEKIPLMLEILARSDDYVMAVLGNRFQEMPLSRIFTDVFLTGNILIRYFYRRMGINLQDPLSGLRVVRWDALRDWKPISKGFEIETEMNLYLLMNGWSIREVPISYRERVGKKKLKVRDAIPILKMLKNYPLEGRP